MRHFGVQCHCALFSEVRILGDAEFTRKRIAHQNGTVAACDMRARGQNVWVVSEVETTASLLVRVLLWAVRLVYMYMV